MRAIALQVKRLYVSQTIPKIQSPPIFTPFGNRRQCGFAANWRSPSSFARTAAPAIVTSDKMRPQIPYGVASGDVSGNAAVLWSRCDRPARAIVEYAATESFNNSQRIVGPAALEKNDFTARLNLSNLPEGQDLFYRFTFQDLADLNLYSIPAIGRLRVPPAQRRNLSFAWSGDTAGQGWGINPDWGGLKIYRKNGV